MDIVGFFNTITGNNLLGWKVVAATFVLMLAGLQVFLAARFWEVTPFPPIKGDTASMLHRWNGRFTLTVGTLVAITCLAGPAGPTSPTRVLLHSLFGTLVFAILTAKFLILRVLKKGEKYLPYVGTGLFLTFAAVWATSVADYVTKR